MRRHQCAVQQRKPDPPATAGVPKTSAPVQQRRLFHRPQVLQLRRDLHLLLGLASLFGLGLVLRIVLILPGLVMEVLLLPLLCPALQTLSGLAALSCPRAASPLTTITWVACQWLLITCSSALPLISMHKRAHFSTDYTVDGPSFSVGHTHAMTTAIIMPPVCPKNVNPAFEAETCLKRKPAPPVHLR